MILFVLPILRKRNNRQNKKISNVDSNFHDKVVLREGNSYLCFFRLHVRVLGAFHEADLRRRSTLASLSPKGAFH